MVALAEVGLGTSDGQGRKAQARMDFHENGNIL
ncbi:Uncharacterised protein [Prescottella equi]|nr:Uncharacterised protein [Prescottella equi]SUE21507.1 Uncharacterised protein [Prescottella equi]